MQRLVSKDRNYVSFTLLRGNAPIKIDFALGTTEIAVGQYVKIRYSPATLQPSLEKSKSAIEESRIRHGHHLLSPEEEAELEWEALSLDCVCDLHRRNLELYICDAIIGLDTFSPKRKHEWLDPRALARCKAMDKTPVSIWIGRCSVPMFTTAPSCSGSDWRRPPQTSRTGSKEN